MRPCILKGLSCDSSICRSKLIKLSSLKIRTCSASLSYYFSTSYFCRKIKFKSFCTDVWRGMIMRSKFIFSWGQIHQIKFFFIFHEVKIPNNDLISWSALFSWDWNSKTALLGNFDLMIDLLVTITIMRSKFKKHY